MIPTGSDVIDPGPTRRRRRTPTAGRDNETRKRRRCGEEDNEERVLLASLTRLSNRGVLKEYGRSVRDGCVYGAVVRELHDTGCWLRETMARCDRLGGQGRMPCLLWREHNGKYLHLLKELLDEVVDQKSTVDSLIQQSWEFLDQETDPLLYYDVTDLENSWLQLKEKLRQLGLRPWTSKPQLCELDQYFAKRKTYTRKLGQDAVGSATSFHCLDSSFSLSSSSEEERSCQTSQSISSDLEIDKDQKFLEVFIPKFTQKHSLESISIDISQVQKDKQLHDPKFFLKKRSSLPSFFHFSPLTTKPQPKPERSERIQYIKDYSGSEESTSSFNVNGCSLEYLEDESSNFDDSFSDEASTQLKDLYFAASEDNLVLMKAAFPSSLGNVCMAEAAQSSEENRSGRNSPLGIRASSFGDDSPVKFKRRRMNEEMPGAESSGGTSPRDSPASLHLMLNPGLTLPLGSTSFDDTFDDFSDSQLSSPGDSPSVFRSKNREALRGKYRKDELWAAIKSDYHYLMDGEIIETCRQSIHTVKKKPTSTESDLSYDSDDLIQTKVSFAEFIQQYKELTDWLNQIQLVTRRQSSSLSEKYLNQTYHEEMLRRSPRRKVFNDYAKQLMRRYPSMKDEINLRLQHLNRQWQTVEKAISPRQGYQDEATMLRDLAEDLNGLKTWLHDVESRLLPLCVRANWTKPELEAKLKDHQALQRDIESHSKIVSAVLKLCEHLQNDKDACSSPDEGEEKDTLQLVAVNLERRWHSIWLQSLEWQCRLEEAITHGKSLYPNPLHDDCDWGARLGFSKTRHLDISSHLDQQDTSDGPLSADDDDDLSDQLCADYDLDWDHSDNSDDVIPFSENEYEKIRVDTDCQTDDLGQLSPGASSATSSKGSACSSGMDPAIDSALGRSVSDHSINNDNSTVAAAVGVVHITSDQVSRAVNKAKAMRAAPDAGQPLGSKARQAAKQMVLKGDSHDVGYSSESHSNDEPDFGCKPLEYRDDMGRYSREPTLEVAAEGSPDDSIERPRSLTTVVLRRRQPGDSSPEADSGQAASPGSPDKSWRHSMTSAYDTSSQCSEVNSPFDLDATLETSADTSVCTAIDLEEGYEDDLEERNTSVQDLISAGSQNFYCMTSLESDADTRITDAICTGDDLLREGSADGLELPDVTLLGRLDHSTPIKGTVEEYLREMPDLIEEEEPPKCGYSGDNLFDPDIVQCGPELLGAVCELEELRKERSESLSVQMDSEASSREAALSAEDLNLVELDLKKPAPLTKESIRKLIQQAELLVRDSELGPPPSPKFSGRRRKNRSKRTKSSSVGGTDPVFTTDTSALPTEDSHISSCDASSECTDSESEYSTASSEDENTQHPGSSIPGIGCNFKSNTLPRTKPSRRRDQNCSVTELYELTNRLDLSPFSISEGAIDNLSRKHSAMHTSLNHKLRRSKSEMSALTLRRYEAPYRAKKRRLKRSASDDIEDKTISASSLSASQRACQSVPTSRHQSSQEWQSLSSPDKSASGSEALQHDWAIAAEVQKVAALHLSPQRTTLPGTSEVSESDVPEILRTAAESDVDTEDAMLKSMNSTMESFSENAWDNYQDPPYQVASDELTEEKLDDSALPWEQTLEFEEDFTLDCTFGRARRVGVEAKGRPSRDKRASTSTSFLDAGRLDDSDSDLEDFHHVIEESRQQIGVAESVLKKPRKDVMDTGIYLDPSRYGELIATCQTNIKCLQVLNEVIDGEGNVNVTDADLQQVQDIIVQWEVLSSLAAERQHQSRELAALYKDVLAIKAALQEMADVLDVSGFQDVFELEQNIRDLQANKEVQVEEQSLVEKVRAHVDEFSGQNPTVHMARFSEEVVALDGVLDSIVDRTCQRLSELQAVLFSWHDFNETHKELSYLVGRERHHLQCLTLTHDLMTGSLQEAIDTVQELKMMKSDFELYESKLWSLRTLSADILAVCEDSSQRAVRERVTAMDGELSSLCRACDDLTAALEAKVISKGGAALLPPHSPGDVSRSEPEPSVRPSVADQTQMVEKAAELVASRPSFLRRVLRVAVPVQLAVVLLVGLAYLIDPDSFPNLAIVFSPQLRYVRGPPPV